MGKFSGLLICSDFDGTASVKKHVSQATADAIRYFEENGGLFTLATGRHPSILEEIKGASITCNTHLICLNGAMIYDQENRRPLHVSLAPTDCADAFLTLTKEFDGIREFIFFPTYEWKEIKIPPHQTDEILHLTQQPNYKIVVHVDDEPSGAIKQRLSALLGNRVALYCSWLNGIELNAHDSDKGATARRLAKLVGADQLIGIGDYENDLPLIREADIGYAMGNAIDSLKQIADRITDTVENDGVAKMIYSL